MSGLIYAFFVCVDANVNPDFDISDHSFERMAINSHTVFLSPGCGGDLQCHW